MRQSVHQREAALPSSDQRASNLLDAGIAAMKTTPGVEVEMGKARSARSSPSTFKTTTKGISDRKKMKLPSNYQGAYEKALIAAGGTPRRINVLTDENHLDSDSESDFEAPLRHGRVFALYDEPTPRPPTPTQNSFAALASNDMEPEAIGELSEWTHKVDQTPLPTVGSGKPKGLDVFDRITIRNEEELR